MRTCLYRVSDRSMGGHCAGAHRRAARRSNSAGTSRRCVADGSAAQRTTTTGHFAYAATCWLTEC